MSRSRKPALAPPVASKVADAREAMAKAEAEPKRAKFWLEVAVASLTDAAAQADRKRGAQ